MYQTTGSVGRKVSWLMSKITSRMKELVEEQMQWDDETTAYQLHQMLIENGVVISLRTVLRCLTILSWTFRGSACCQLIRDENKGKRLEWCQQNREDTFDNVIWTDESTVQLETHRRFCCHKEGQATKPKPWYVECIFYINVRYRFYNHFYFIHAVLNILSKCMYGQASQEGDVPGYVFLEALWIASFYWYPRQHASSICHIYLPRLP